MANSLSKKITEEGPRNAVVMLTGVLTDSDITEAPAIRLSDFTNNDQNCTGLWGFRVDFIEYSISNGLEVKLEWNSIDPEAIMPLAGRGRIHATNYGGFIPDRTRTGYDGNINLSTLGFAIGTTQTFTIVLELVKLYTP